MAAVSILCAYHNEAALIAQTVRSLNEQTFRDFDAIFVDDGSRDGTSAIVQAEARFPHRIVRNDTNLGLVRSLNRGLERTAPLVARIDADDLMLPGRLEAQVAAFQRDPSLVLLGGHALKIDEDGAVFGRIVVPTTDAACRFALNFYAPFVHPAVMFRRDDVQAVGGYRESSFPAEDYDLWCRLAARGRIGNLSDPLIRYRVRASGSITADKRALQLARHADVIDRYRLTGGRTLSQAGLQLRKIARLMVVMPWTGRARVVRKAVRLLTPVPTAERD